MIVPAVIPQSFDHLRDALLSVSSFAHEVQVDIVDGRFVPFTSWPYRGSGSVMLLKEFSDDFILEVDLMIQDPMSALPLYIDAGVKKVVVHLESVTDLTAIRMHQAKHGYMLGLSVTNDTPLTVLTDVLKPTDYVQLMGIRKIGSQGQPFDEEVLSRIKILRSAYPKMTISIDGSVNQNTIARLREAGANRFVSGSAIFDAPDPRVAYEALRVC
jgi:ribulose-phosphate 3-epimerase